MAKSQETFSKKEKEKKRRKKRQEKLERREQRKLEKAERGKLSFEDQISYVDENGNLTDTPPDPSKRKRVKLEDIVLGVPSRESEPYDPNRKGIVKFFNGEKGYGFITDSESKESIFVHINNVNEPIGENDKVTFEVEMGPKGPNAVNVKIAPPEPKPQPIKKEAIPEKKTTTDNPEAKQTEETKAESPSEETKA